MHTTIKKKYWSKIRWILLAFVLAILSWQIVYYSGPEKLRLDDFMEYWAAGRINSSGGNPYDYIQMQNLQIEFGDNVIMMWNPPWTLTLVMPFSLLSYPVSRTLWLLLNIAFVIICVDWLWIYYGGPRRQRYLAQIIAFSFFPTLHTLNRGQISAFILVGVVGFMYFINHRQWIWGGACLILISIKPHLLYLFWIVLVLWIIVKSRWKFAVCGLIAGFIAILIPLLTNPDVIKQYLSAALNHPPLYWKTPTLGSILRLLFGVDLYWLQFLPSILCAICFFFYLFRNRYDWNWQEQIPVVLVVSVATTSFGWSWDVIVILPAIIQGAILVFDSDKRIVKSLAILSYLFINILAIVLSFLPFSLLSYFWLAPTFAILYWCLRAWTHESNVINY